MNTIKIKIRDRKPVVFAKMMPDEWHIDLSLVPVSKHNRRRTAAVMFRDNVQLLTPGNLRRAKGIMVYHFDTGRIEIRNRFRADIDIGMTL